MPWWEQMEDTGFPTRKCHSPQSWNWVQKKWYRYRKRIFENTKQNRVQSVPLALILFAHPSFGVLMPIKVQLGDLSFNSTFPNVFQWEWIMSSLEMSTILELYLFVWCLCVHALWAYECAGTHANVWTCVQDNDPCWICCNITLLIMFWDKVSPWIWSLLIG